MNGKSNKEITEFINTLCGKYSNQLQAFKEPRLYAHINIYFRQLPWILFKEIGIYCEQSYDHSPWSPYRQAAYKLTIKENKLVLENYKLKDSRRSEKGSGGSEEKRGNRKVKKGRGREKIKGAKRG